MGDGAIDRYERDGFVRVADRLAPAQVDELRERCLRATDVARTAASTDRYSLAVPDESPRDVAPLIDAFHHVAADLLEADVESTFVLWHAVTARLSDGRGWHQALAYYNLPYSPNGVSVPLDELEFIVMLDDATAEEMAPMFAPGHHVAPMLEHRRALDAQMGFELVDPGRQLVLDEAVLVPLSAGDAVAYTLGTPHACVCAGEADRSEVLFVRLGFRGLRP